MQATSTTVPLPGRAIVVGVDEKGQSDHAIVRADELGRALHLPVHRVHAVGWTRDLGAALDPFPAQLWRELEPRVRLELERHLSTLPALTDAANAAASLRIVPGSAAKAILDEARTTGAGLIVLGPHVRHGVLDFGSTLRAVYARTHVAVWMQPGPVEPVRTILAAVDLSTHSLAALDVACTLAASLGARVRALYAWLPPVLLAGPAELATIEWPVPYDELVAGERERFARVMSEARWHGVPHEAEFVEGEAVGAILAAAGRADLVVIGTQGRTGFASTVLGGVAYSVLKRCMTPTLAIPASQAVRES